MTWAGGPALTDMCDMLSWQHTLTPSVEMELSPLHFPRPGFSSYAPRKLGVQWAGCAVLQILNLTSMENTARILAVGEWKEETQKQLPAHGS